MTTPELVIGFITTIVALWFLSIIALFAVRPKGMSLAETVRLVPDLLRLLTRLSKDRSLPAPVRWRIGILLIYLGSPIDFIPDFIPVVGYADDAILTYVVLRSVLKRTNTDILEQHWTGSAEGLAAMKRLFGI